MRIGSLFSGAGGLDMAVEAVFGGRTVWHSEIDKAASKVLAHRWPDVPNLGSITEIDWATVEPVDVLCGGFPCQDVSAAGKRAGIKAGTRSGLWAVFADAIDALRPQYVIIENVRGLLSATAHRAVESDNTVVGNRSDRPVLRALGAVLGDLSDIRYDAVWATVAAADVGAPHRRERVFILACAADPKENGLSGQGLSGRVDETQPQPGRGAVPLSSNASHSSRIGWDEGRPESARLVGGFDAAVSGDEPGRVELLPTPCVVDRLATGEMTLEEWDESRRSQKERGVGSFGPRGDSLGAAILRVEEGTERPDYSTTKARRGGDEPGVALLPTPAARDFKGSDTAGDHNRHSPGMDAVTYHFPALLPTPRTSDTNGAGHHGDGGMDVRTTVTLLPTPAAQDGNGGGRYSSEGHQTTLPGEARLLCTPSASDGAGGKTSRSGGRIDEPLLGGQAREMESGWGKYAPAIARWEQIVGPAPAPTEPNKNGNPRLSAAFSEWLMGWPAGWVTDPAIGISRNDQLRIVGNGVCVQQAIAALRYLLAVTV